MHDRPANDLLVKLLSSTKHALKWLLSRIEVQHSYCFNALRLEFLEITIVNF